jgi:hypothetical protein
MVRYILVLLLLITALPADAKAAEPGHSYWKFGDYGVILDFWRCQQDVLCGNVRNIDVTDPKLRDKAAKPLRKKRDEITDADLLRFCGFTPVAFEVRPVRAGPDNGGLGHWAGMIRVDRTNAMTPVQYGTKPVLLYTFDVEGRNQGQAMRVFVSKTWLPSFIGKSYTLTRVTNPPPACRKSAETTR